MQEIQDMYVWSLGQEDSCLKNSTERGHWQVAVQSAGSDWVTKHKYNVSEDTEILRKNQKKNEKKKH